MAASPSGPDPRSRRSKHGLGLVVLVMGQQQVPDPGMGGQFGQRGIADIPGGGFHAPLIDVHNHPPAVAFRLQQPCQPMRLVPPIVGGGLKAMMNVKTMQAHPAAAGRMSGMQGQHGGIRPGAERHANGRITGQRRQGSFEAPAAAPGQAPIPKGRLPDAPA